MATPVIRSIARWPDCKGQCHYRFMACRLREPPSARPSWAMKSSLASQASGGFSGTKLKKRNLACCNFAARLSESAIRSVEPRPPTCWCSVGVQWAMGVKTSSGPLLENNQRELAGTDDTDKVMRWKNTTRQELLMSDVENCFGHVSDGWGPTRIPPPS